MSKFVMSATWEDVPHLSPEQKAELLASIPPYQRDARSRGIPQLGSGAIYPVPESEILVDPFEIPPWWPRSYGMDVGWKATAVVHGAIDQETDIAYIYADYLRGQAEPPVHVSAIKARGAWMNGVIDPASRGRSQKDGEQLLQIYQENGLLLSTAYNGVEAGLYDVWNRMVTGRLKVFRTCTKWLEEYRLYRRDEKGHVVKVNDHLMDATRYWVMSGIDRATRPPQQYEKYAERMGLQNPRNGSVRSDWDPFAEM